MPRWAPLQCPTFQITPSQPGNHHPRTRHGRGTFTVMPAGGGKSLCYQLPVKPLPGTRVAVSPLISLTKDQADATNAFGLAAAAVNNAPGAGERNHIRAALQANDLNLLYARRNTSACRNFAHPQKPCASPFSLSAKRTAFRNGARFPARLSRSVHFAGRVFRLPRFRRYRNGHSARRGRHHGTDGPCGSPENTGVL